MSLQLFYFQDSSELIRFDDWDISWVGPNIFKSLDDMKNHSAYASSSSHVECAMLISKNNFYVALFTNV